MRVMAIAKKNNSANLEIDAIEVAVLLALLERVGGSPTDSYRKVSDSMNEKLKNIGISEELISRVSHKAIFGEGVQFNDGY